MKINKGKVSLECSPLTPYHSLSIAHPSGRDIPSTVVTRFTTPPGRRFPSPPSNSPTNEKPLYLELPVYSNGLSVYNSTSQLPFSIKQLSFALLYSSPSLCRLACGFVPDYSSLLCPNKCIFAVKIHGSFTFKVSTETQ